MFNIHRVQLDWGGRQLTLETGRLARQADGAVFASYGDTTVIATVVAAKQPKEGIDFLPLTCNYQEKYYAADRKRDPGLAFDRPSGAAVVRRRLALRHPGHRDGAIARPGK